MRPKDRPNDFRFVGWVVRTEVTGVTVWLTVNEHRVCACNASKDAIVFGSLRQASKAKKWLGLVNGRVYRRWVRAKLKPRRELLEELAAEVRRWVNFGVRRNEAWSYQSRVNDLLVDLRNDERRRTEKRSS